MFYGGLLAVLYVATNRISFVVIGLIAFGIGAWYLGTHIPHIDARVTAWLHPFNKVEYTKLGGSYQLANAHFRAGRRRPVRPGPRSGDADGPGSNPPVYLVPAPVDRHDLRGHH